MIKSINHDMPVLSDNCMIAENASVVGNVTIRQDTSVWYGAVIRGDIESITIDTYSNIQDNVIIHTSESHLTKIGSHVTIGHGAVLHGCVIDDYTLIGIGSIVLDKVKIGEHCMIGAGSLLTKGMEIPPYSMVYGRPARIIRPLRPDEIKELHDIADRNYHHAVMNFKE